MSTVVRVIEKAMESDPVGTSFLVDEAVASWMVAEADSYAGPLAKAMGAAAQERLNVAKRYLGRLYVEQVAKGQYPDDDAQKAADYLSGLQLFIAKAGGVDEKTRATRRRNAQTQPRQGGGRFGYRAINQDASAQVLGPQEERSPHAEQYVETGAKGKVNYSASTLAQGHVQQLERHQAQWKQAEDEAYNLHQDFGGGNKDVDVEVQLLNDNGTLDVRTMPLSEVPKKGLAGLGGGSIDPLHQNILSVELRSDDKDQAGRVAQFNALGYLRGSPGHRNQAWDVAQEGDWKGLLGASDVNQTWLYRMFGRLNAGASVLDAIPGGEKYADFARLAGSLGPQADTVLGPHVRRAAYRYRGTEKTPDADLRADLSGQEWDVVQQLAHVGAGPTEVKELLKPSIAQSTRPGANGPEQDKTLASAVLRAERDNVTGDQLRLQVASDVAAAHLARTLPTPKAAELSEASGHVLPSQGVLINAEGKIVSQSVGYADDHYLPFNLKNLASLRGGQYVRTRVQGGLTGEDVYTIIQGGARMGTVVSGSGVFSLEMDPNFRGARGNSDKARQVYTRYLKILDAVDQSGMYLQDIPAVERATLLARAEGFVPPGADEVTRKKVVADRYNASLSQARRAAATIGQDELAALNAQAKQEATAAGGSVQAQARLADDLFSEKMDQAMEGRVEQLSLNAAGYALALKTLQEQFPYFIRKVGYEPLKGEGGFLRQRGQSDKGIKTQGGSDRGYALKIIAFIINTFFSFKIDLFILFINLFV